MALAYFRGDERPAWATTITINGTADDMTSGYTFQVKIFQRIASPVLTKTTNIAGATGGLVTVTWVANDLDIAPGNYTAQLKATRTADTAEWTITEDLLIKARA
jgi:hypothetical protein